VKGGPPRRVAWPKRAIGSANAVVDGVEREDMLDAAL